MSNSLKLSTYTEEDLAELSEEKRHYTEVMGFYVWSDTNLSMVKAYLRRVDKLTALVRYGVSEENWKRAQ